MRRLTGNDALVSALQRDPLQADVPSKDRVLLVYAAKLTLQPASVGADDLAALRAAGWDDRAILDLNQAVSYFNYVNRIADGLGVRLESERTDSDLRRSARPRPCH